MTLDGLGFFSPDLTKVGPLNLRCNVYVLDFVLIPGSLRPLVDIFADSNKSSL